MNTLFSLTKRNVKLFFKDKARFFTSLITPVILLVLFITFLGDIYRDGFKNNLAQFQISDKLVNAFAGGQVVACILAVSCVTVAFCSNFLMVQDKVTGTIKDFTSSPAKPWIIALSYFLATLISTLFVCYLGAAACFIYLAVVGFYRTAVDVILLLVDIFLLTLFGTALSSLINFFLSTQGQISAVGTIVSAGYGFICGAYRPINSMGKGLQVFNSFLPNVYGTILTRQHCLNGARTALKDEGVPQVAIDKISDYFDLNFYFFDHKVPSYARYIVLISYILVFIAVYVALNYIKRRKKKFIRLKK